MSAFNERKKPPVPGGRVDTDHIAFWDSTGGLKHHFMANKPSDAYSFPINRPAQVKAVAYHSPKYCYVLREALDAQKKGEKLLCFVNWPLTSQWVNLFLFAHAFQLIMR